MEFKIHISFEKIDSTQDECDSFEDKREYSRIKYSNFGIPVLNLLYHCLIEITAISMV